MRIKPSLIIQLLNKGSSPTDVAANLGIHKATVYRWIKRARVSPGKLSSRSLKRKSTRPKHIHFALSTSQKDLAIETRKQRGSMAEKIVKRLSLPCHPSTAHRLFKSKGLVRKYGHHRRPRFQNTTHMHLGNTKTIGYLQMDVKYITPQLCGLPYTCFEYAVIDIFSRYKEAVILNHLDQDASISALLQILPKIPFKPIFLQTDNGLEFQGRFHKLCEDINLKHHLIHKNTPNENALIERSFRTDEEEFFFWLKKAPANYDQLREWFASWLHEYNYTRPHLGIDLKTPYEIVANVLLG